MSKEVQASVGKANVILAIVDYFGSDSLDGHNSTLTSLVHCFFKKKTTEFKHTCVLADCHEYFILQRGLTSNIYHARNRI